MKTWSTHGIQLGFTQKIYFTIASISVGPPAHGWSQCIFLSNPKLGGRSGWCTGNVQCCTYYRDKTEHILGNVNSRQSWNKLWCRIKSLKISNVQSLIFAAFAHFVVFLRLNFMKLSETMINNCCLAVEHYDLLEKPNSVNINLRKLKSWKSHVASENYWLMVMMSRLHSPRISPPNII